MNIFKSIALVATLASAMFAVPVDAHHSPFHESNMRVTKVVNICVTNFSGNPVVRRFEYNSDGRELRFITTEESCNNKSRSEAQSVPPVPAYPAAAYILATTPLGVAAKGCMENKMILQLRADGSQYRSTISPCTIKRG